LGVLTHAELGRKFDRHEQAIHQFSARNAAEIGVVRSRNNQDLRERLAEVSIADKAARVVVDGRLRDDLLALLGDDGLDARTRYQYTKTVMALQRAVAEELGDLCSSIDLAVSKNPITDFDTIVVDDDGSFHAVAGTQAG